MAEMREELLEELLKEYKNPEDLPGEQGIIKALSKRLLEKVISKELTHHLGYEKNGTSPDKNYRNGTTSKKVKSKHGEMDLTIPRDRQGEFEPQLIKKHQRRFDGFDEKILSMYSRGMSVRDIQEHLMDLYGTEVSHDLISTVTDGVLEEVKQWQSRPLEDIYPIVYMDAIFVKVRDNGHVIKKAIYFALGVNSEGEKELLGMWIAKNEGAKFRLTVITELKNRGLKDIYIACVDGLKGFPEAIESIYPKTQVQLCIVHMVRYSLKYVPWKDRKAVASDLKEVYSAANEEAAKTALSRFGEIRDEKYPSIRETWERNWEGIIPFMIYPEHIRKAIYTTNAIESLNHSLKKVTKTRGAFPTDEAVFKLLYLAIRNVSKRWTRPISNWKEALNQFAIIFDDRFPSNL